MNIQWGQRDGNLRRLGTVRPSTALLAALLTALLTVGLLAGCAETAPTTGQADIDRLVERYPGLNGAQAERGRVARIVDGDTLELDGGVKVRLIGVDTPEVHGKTEPYGKEASAFAKRELDGRDVLLFPDASDADRYGRKLRYVFVAGDDRMFNERLAAEGYANTMTIAPNVAFADTFVRAEREARAAGRGLWADGSGAEPDSAAEPGAGQPSAGSTNGGATSGGSTSGGSTNAGSADGEAGDPPACPDPIKGNINSRGDKIYHVKGAAAYERTKPEAWFCSEQEAQEAGFRKAAR